MRDVNEELRGMKLVRPAKGGGTGSPAVWAWITECDQESGLCLAKIFPNGTDDPLNETEPTTGQEVMAWNGPEAWHRVGDVVILMPVSGSGINYVVLDKIKGFAWEPPEAYESDYELTLDTTCCADTVPEEEPT